MSDSDILAKIKSGEYKTVQNTGKSDVWKSFHKIRNNITNEIVPFAICGRCERIFKFEKGSSPSNLKKHVCYKRHHKVDCTVAPPKKRTTKKSPATSTVSTDKIQDKILQSCVKFVASDLRPSETVDGNGFKAMARCLIEVGMQLGKKHSSVDEILPNSAALKCSLHKLHASELESFVSNLKPVIENGRCAGTLNMWTDSTKLRNFLALNVHYIDTTWQLHKYIIYYTIPFIRTLCTVEFGPYNGNIEESSENIIRSIGDKFERLNLQRDLHNKITFTIDQASNIRKALEHHSSINCVTYVLNTILNHVFDKQALQEFAPQVLNLIAKCQSLMESLECTGRNHLPETTAKQECTSAGWSMKFNTYPAHQNLNAIENILKKSIELHSLTANEKYLLDRVIAFLEPFKIMILLLEDDKGPTIHLVLLHMHILKEKLLKLQNEEYYNEMQSIVAHCLENVFYTKYHPDRIHKIAAFLWPEYKQLRYLNESERQEVYSLVREELLNISLWTSQAGPPNILAEHFKLESDVNDILAKYKDIHSPKYHKYESQIDLQMETYKNACYVEKDILLWWRLHGKEFPLLAELAQRVLCIPASGVTSERCLSKANRVLEEGQSGNLNDKNLDAILFLHSQWKEVLA